MTKREGGLGNKLLILRRHSLWTASNLFHKNLQLTGKVQGFINEPRSYAYEGGVLGGSRRRFPVDMSGFAVHLSLIHTRSELGANIMPYHQPYQEEGFLNSLQLK